MKLFSLDQTPFESVSHDPGLKKRVLTKGTLPYVKHISHIVLQPGNRVSEHSHSNDVEVLYCIRGNAVFLINGKKIPITKGHLLLIEPGETHSIPEIIQETELLYFRTTSLSVSHISAQGL